MKPLNVTSNQVMFLVYQNIYKSKNTGYMIIGEGLFPSVEEAQAKAKDGDKREYIKTASSIVLLLKEGVC